MRITSMMAAAAAIGALVVFTSCSDGRPSEPTVATETPRAADPPEKVGPQPVAAQAGGEVNPAETQPGGAALVQERCVGCHDLKRVTSKRANAQQWAAIVDDMISKGAKLNSQERDEVIRYLASRR